MKKISGFSRLKGLAAGGAMSIAGLVGGGTARAASTALPLDIARSSALWSSIGNNSRFPSSGAVTTTNGVAFAQSTLAYGISDAAVATSPSGGGSGAFGDAFDNAMILSVNGTVFQNPDSTVDLTGDTVTSDTVTIVPGVNAQVRYSFITGRPVVRALYSLTNTTAAPINVNAAVLGDYGSDNGTQVVATSNGNTVIEASDLWYITDDGGGGGGKGQAKGTRRDGSPDGVGGGGDPRISLSRYGTGAAVLPFNALTPGNGDSQTATFGLRYPITIAPGATARLLVFAQLSEPDISTAAAIAAARDFESIAAVQAAGLLAGVSAAEVSEIVNYVRPAEPVVSLPVPALSPTGLLAMLGAVGGLGYLTLRRRKKTAA